MAILLGRNGDWTDMNWIQKVPLVVFLSSKILTDLYHPVPSLKKKQDWLKQPTATYQAKRVRKCGHLSQLMSSIVLLGKKNQGTGCFCGAHAAVLMPLPNGVAVFDGKKIWKHVKA